MAPTTTIAAAAATVPAPSIMALDQTANLPEADQDALKAAVFQRLHPRVYMERFVKEEIRPDGRAFGDFREVSVNVGSISTADGSALVRMGDTTVVCGVKAEIAEPELDREGEGFLVPNVDLPAMCSPRFKPGPPSEEAQVLSSRLNEVLVASNLVPLSSLCIHPGKAAWVLYVDATCINYDGNAFDAVLLAMVAAIRNTKLPKATYNPDTHRTTCGSRLAPRVPLQLTADTIPLSMSFGLFEATHLLADPTAFEEPLLSSTLSVVLNSPNDILSVFQLGSFTATDTEENTEQNTPARHDVLEECVKRAGERRVELERLLLAADV